MENILTTPSEDPDGIIVKKIKTPEGVTIEVMAPLGLNVNVVMEHYPPSITADNASTDSNSHQINWFRDRTVLKPSPSLSRRFEVQPPEFTTSGRMIVQLVRGDMFYPLYATDQTDASGKVGVRLVWSDYYGMVSKKEYRILRQESLTEEPKEVARQTSPNTFFDDSVQPNKTYLYWLERMEDRIPHESDTLKVTILY